MKEIIATDNPVEMNLIKQLLESHDIPSFVMDENIGRLYPGTHMMTSRLMVLDEDFERAAEIIRSAESDG